MFRNRIKKAVSIAISFGLVLGLTIGSSPVYAKDEGQTEDVVENVLVNTDAAADRLSSNYTSVSKSYTAKDYEAETVCFYFADCLEDETILTTDSFDYEGSSGVATVGAGDSFRVKINVPETALYLVGLDYLSYDTSILPVEIGVKIDGDYPFYEARSMVFETTWISKKVDTDRYGNQIVALPEKDIKWEHKNFGDASYRYSQPLKIELTEGEHEFEFLMQEGKVLLGGLTLEAPKKIDDYTGSEKAEGNELITIEAEDFYERNDSSIHATGEYSSKINPLNVKTTVLNLIDEDSFNEAGQTVTYKFEVVTAGYYYIGMNYRQSEQNDFPVFVD
ncbi:MAG: ABC transporter substrate-binding protein, partial [Lachnospiraceae bacterium]|nr:ABC transporter substrate-binding protein [Lachnospiraceae bacterium]